MGDIRVRSLVVSIFTGINWIPLPNASVEVDGERLVIRCASLLPVKPSGRIYVAA